MISLQTVVNYIVLVGIVTATRVNAAQQPSFEMRFNTTSQSLPLSSEERSAQFRDTLINKTGQTITIAIVPRVTKLPQSWFSYVCDEEKCFPPEVDTITVTIQGSQRYVIKINIVIGDTFKVHDTAAMRIVAFETAAPSKSLQEDIRFFITRDGIPIVNTLKTTKNGMGKMVAFHKTGPNRMRATVSGAPHFICSIYTPDGRMVYRFNESSTSDVNYPLDLASVATQRYIYHLWTPQRSESGLVIP